MPAGQEVMADYATAGNMLVSEPTIAETERAYLESAGESLPERLIGHIRLIGHSLGDPPPVLPKPVGLRR